MMISFIKWKAEDIIHFYLYRQHLKTIVHFGDPSFKRYVKNLEIVCSRTIKIVRILLHVNLEKLKGLFILAKRILIYNMIVA